MNLELGNHIQLEKAGYRRFLTHFIFIQSSTSLLAQGAALETGSTAWTRGPPSLVEEDEHRGTEEEQAAAKMVPRLCENSPPPLAVL